MRKIVLCSLNLPKQKDSTWLSRNANFLKNRERCLPLVVLQPDPFKGTHSKNTCQHCHIAYPATDFSLYSWQNRPQCSAQGASCQACWQVLMSVECLSGHLRTLFTVYSLANIHTSKHSDAQWGVSCACTFELLCPQDTDDLERYFIVNSKLPGPKTVQITEIYEQLF